MAEMHAMPDNWQEQLKTEYPKRSGVKAWGGMKMMLAVRRALFDHDWQTIIDGVKRYKAWCVSNDKEGTEYVRMPLGFIQDQCYLEDFEVESTRRRTTAEIIADEEAERVRKG